MPGGTANKPVIQCPRCFHRVQIQSDGTCPACAAVIEKKFQSNANSEDGCRNQTGSSDSDANSTVRHLSTTPFSPPSGPARRLVQGPPVRSKFLAATHARFTLDLQAGDADLETALVGDGKVGVAYFVSVEYEE